MRFLGNIDAHIDSKGRVFLPAAFRKELQQGGDERMVMRKDIHQTCLMLYPESVWNSQMDAMFANADEWDEVERQVLRQYMSDVEILALDATGRLLVPRRYIELAQIGNEVRFLGMSQTIEIWNPDLLDKPRLDQPTYASHLKQIMNRKKAPSNDQ